MTLSAAQLEASTGAVFLVPASLARQSKRLLDRLATDKSESIKQKRRQYYAFSQHEIRNALVLLDLPGGTTVQFTRLFAGKLVWVVSKTTVKGVAAIPPQTLFSVTKVLLRSEQMPRIDVVDVVGGGDKPCTRSADDYATNRFKIYTHGTLSSLPAIRFEEPLVFHSPSYGCKISERLVESGTGIPIVSQPNDEVMAELFPTEMFVLLSIHKDRQEVLESILTRAKLLRMRHFRTTEKITAWKLKGDRASVELAVEHATTLLNTHKLRARRGWERSFSRNRARAEKALATLADARRKLAMAEASLQTLGPLIVATERDAEKIIEDLRQLRSVTQVAVVGEELRVTTDTIYSTLLTSNPRRMFKIGQIEIGLNVVTGAIRFTNLTDPRDHLAAPHIGQGAHGCLDAQIELEVRTHLLNDEWSAAVQVCIRLLTASKHKNESALWPEVDPITRLPLR